MTTETTTKEPAWGSVALATEAIEDAQRLEEVWLRAYCAAIPISDTSYHPSIKADECLAEFKKRFRK